jgi:hypothetical protein
MKDPKSIPVELYRKAIEGEFRNRGIPLPPPAVLETMAKETRQGVIDASHGWPVPSSGTVMGAANAAVSKYVSMTKGAAAVKPQAKAAGTTSASAVSMPRARKVTAKSSPPRSMETSSAPMSLSDFGEGVVQLYPVVAAEYLSQRKKAPSEIEVLELAIALREELVKQVRTTR